jgi:hypothetical protein
LCKGNDALQPPRPTRRGEITPLSPDRYKLQLTIGGSTLEKLRLAKDMLRHAIPSGDDEAVLDRALTVLLADLARRKFAATEKPGRSRGAAPASRHIPAEVKRAVWLRDLGRCAFVAADGRRCSERGFLEFHHVRPYAAGGEATVSNIRLTCKRHNGYEARVYFGHKRIADDVRNEWAPGTIVREQAAAYGRGASAAAFVPASELRPEDVLPPGCRRQSFRNELETQGRPPGRFEGLTQPAKRLGAPQDP